MAEFKILRSDVVRLVGQCPLLDLFDRVARQLSSKKLVATNVVVATPDALTYPNGWQASDTAFLLDTSPRALFLMAKAGLIPLSPRQALTEIVKGGKGMGGVRPQVAKVVTARQDSVAVLFVKAQRAPLSRRLGRVASPP